MIVVDGERLTPVEITQLAYRLDHFVLAEAALYRAEQSYEFGERAAARRPIYGRSTGVGANRDAILVDPAAQAGALLRSHATASGEPRSRERVRAMLAVRLNQLAAGGSGASPDVLRALAEMLAADALPPVRELGSLGTGDLPALASTALALAGLRATSPPLTRTVRMGIGDALAFLSSNAAALGDAALALVEIRKLARASVVVAALTFLGVDGNPEAFDPAVERVTPFDGARQVCRSMRGLIAGGAPPARIQDPFGLRAMPQVHGALVDALAALDTTITRMVNAPSENPVLLPDEGLAHHGGFHAAYLAQALDGTLLALAESAQLVLARLTMLSEPAFTGQPSFLGDGTPGASGVMIVEYVAASALAGLRAAAQPVSMQTVTLSRGVEDDASMASLAAHKALRAAADYRVALACELVAAVRCLRLRAVAPTTALAAALRACSALDPDAADRDLTPDLDAAAGVLEELEELAQIMSSSGRSSSA